MANSSKDELRKNSTYRNEIQIAESRRDTIAPEHEVKRDNPVLETSAFTKMMQSVHAESTERHKMRAQKQLHEKQISDQRVLEAKQRDEQEKVTAEERKKQEEIMWKYNFDRDNDNRYDPEEMASKGTIENGPIHETDYEKTEQEEYQKELEKDIEDDIERDGLSRDDDNFYEEWGFPGY